MHSAFNDLQCNKPIWFAVPWIVIIGVVSFETLWSCLPCLQHEVQCSWEFFLFLSRSVALLFSCSCLLSEVEQERSRCISQSLHLTELGQDVADRQWGQKQLPYAYLPVCFVGTTPFFKLAPKILLWCLPLLPSNNLNVECFSFTVKSQRLVCSGPSMPPPSSVGVITGNAVLMLLYILSGVM